MMEFTFEKSAWEAAVEAMRPGDTLSAVRFLTLLEGEDEVAAEDALQALEDKGIALDASALPKFAASGDTALRLRQEQQLVHSGDLLSGLEENDPLRLYLEELAAIPAAGDTEVLARQYAEGDESAVPQLTNLMLSRVVAAATEFTGRGVLLLDLIQEASLGLWQGIRSYTGGDFESHCQWWICQYLAKAVTLQARASGVGQKLRQGLEDYRQVDQQLLAELGRNPTLEEIAQHLHITPEEASVYEKTLETVRVRAKADEAKTPAEPTPEDEQAVEDTAYFQARQRILELLSTLSQADAKLLTLRFGLEGGMPLSPEETGKKLGMTAQEVVEREAAALCALRQQSE